MITAPGMQCNGPVFLQAANAFILHAFRASSLQAHVCEGLAKRESPQAVAEDGLQIGAMQGLY